MTAMAGRSALLSSMAPSAFAFAFALPSTLPVASSSSSVETITAKFNGCRCCDLKRNLKRNPTSRIVARSRRGSAWSAFGLAPSDGRVAMATFKITLKTPDGVKEFQSSDSENILEGAESQGLELPFSCRAGACCSCAGVVESGKLDQSEQSFLDDEQIEQGYVLTCIAYPLSDVVIATHKEGDING